MIFLSLILSINYYTMFTHEMKNQLSILSIAVSHHSTDVVPALYDSVPNVRKLYKFLNDHFFKMMQTIEGEKELYTYFNLSQKTFMDNLNYLICFVATIQMLVQGKERNVYTKRQIKSWNKTHRQLLTFEDNYKKYAIGLIKVIPSDLTEIIASYL